MLSLEMFGDLLKVVRGRVEVILILDFLNPLG